MDDFTFSFHASDLRELNISASEACVLCLIKYRESYADNPNPGWCWESRSNMAEMLNMSRSGLISLIDSLVERGILLKHKQMGWLKSDFRTGGPIFVPTVRKVDHESDNLPVRFSTEPVRFSDPKGNINIQSKYLTEDNIPTSVLTPENDSIVTPIKATKKQPKEYNPIVIWATEKMKEVISRHAKLKFNADPKAINTIFARLQDRDALILSVLYMYYLYDRNDDYAVIIDSFRSFKQKFEKLMINAESILRKRFNADRDTGGIFKVDHEKKLMLVWSVAHLNPNGRRTLAELTEAGYKVYEFIKLNNGKEKEKNVA